jgi:hypothetical protein
MILDYADGIAITGNLQRNGKIFMIMRHRIHQRKLQMIRLIELQGKSLKNELSAKKLVKSLGC